MANMIDYILWRGDLTMDRVPVGEVDALILSYLAYMPFDGIVPSSFGESVRLGDALEEILKKHEAGELPLAFSPKEDKRLLEAAKDSARFGDLRACGFVHRFDKEREEQFCAMAFCLPGAPAVIAFRGTDRTVVGWKEDFNMTYCGVVPAQRSAIGYVNEASQALGGKMVLCGHSKGGNLAAYASIFSRPDAQACIDCVYNFDGPGFNEEVITSEEFARVDRRIRVFVPKSSMVGILLWHSEPPTVVESESVSVLQHLPYHWQVLGAKLVAADGLTGDSRLTDATLKRWLQSLSQDLRRQVIDGIYGVISASDGHQLSDLFEPRSVLAILKAAGAMDEETRAALLQALRLLGDTLKETVPDFIDEKTDELRMKALGDKAENE